MADEYAWSWLQQRIGALEDHWPAMLKRLVVLEQQVANRAVASENIDHIALKEAAARARAMANSVRVEAPLRSDTRPLIEMSAFVRKVAEITSTGDVYSANAVLDYLIREAREILKRST